MRFTIQSYDGFATSIDVEENTPVWKIKEIIGGKTGLSSVYQILTCDYKNLSDTDIAKNIRRDTIDLTTTISTPLLILHYLDLPPPIKTKSNSIYREQLVYKKDTSAAAYSFDNQGPLDVNKLIQGQPCYRTPRPLQKEYRKTLVLSDWTAEQWPPAIVELVNRFIQEYTQAGFVIYLVQDNQLVKVDSDLTFAQRKAMSPKTFEAITKMASEKRITRDALYILDAEEILRLYGHSTSPTRTVNAHYYTHFFSHSAEEIFNIVAQTRPTTTCTVFPDDVGIAQDLAERLHLPIITHFRALRLNEEQLRILLEQQVLFIDGLSISTAQLQTIELLTLIDIHSKDISAKLAELLSQCTQLQHLMITNCSSINQNTLHSAPLASLKTLYLEYCPLSPEEIYQVLSNCSSLTQLSLAGYKYLTLDLLTHPKLKHLTSLNLSHTQLTPGLIQGCLNNSPNLITLDLAYCQGLEGIIEVKLQGLVSSLEVLNVEKSSISCTGLDRLLNNTTRLKRLDISRCRNLANDLESTLYRANREPERYVSNLSSKQRCDILKNTKQLETLEVLKLRVG